MFYICVNLINVNTYGQNQCDLQKFHSKLKNLLQTREKIKMFTINMWKYFLKQNQKIYIYIKILVK